MDGTGDILPSVGDHTVGGAHNTVESPITFLHLIHLISVSYTHLTLPTILLV